MAFCIPYKIVNNFNCSYGQNTNTTAIYCLTIHVWPISTVLETEREHPLTFLGLNMLLRGTDIRTKCHA
jgi:hypothetical protein